MKKILIILIVIIVAAGAFFAFNSYIYNQKQSEITPGEYAGDVMITPISHATMVLYWNETVIYTDPVGGAEAFANQPDADIILITDIHGDHLNEETLLAVTKDKTKIIAPQAVVDLLPTDLLSRVRILNNGQVITEGLFAIQAIPMYNLPETDDSRHAKGRGNGYVLESDGKRVYIAGDTADIPEMRALQDIDIAFVPMNLPYTMDVETAADAVLDFKPAQVYPYHYRTPEGFSDVAKFKELVNSSDPSIEVVLLDWYAN